MFYIDKYVANEVSMRVLPIKNYQLCDAQCKNKSMYKLLYIGAYIVVIYDMNDYDKYVYNIHKKKI